MSRQEEQACLTAFIRCVDANLRFRCTDSATRAKHYFNWILGWIDHANGIPVRANQDPETRASWFAGRNARDEWKRSTEVEPEAAEYIPTNPDKHPVLRAYDPNPDDSNK